MRLIVDIDIGSVLIKALLGLACLVALVWLTR
jgi:hypothetical protein